MKSLFFLGITFVMSASAFAQKQGDQLPYNKEKLDSLFNQSPLFKQPFGIPAPKNEFNIPENKLVVSRQSFETLNPDAKLITTTERGKIYSMSLDNMAVLVPDMQKVERMPGSGVYKMAPQSRMPNPLYPDAKPKKK